MTGKVKSNKKSGLPRGVYLNNAKTRYIVKITVKGKSAYQGTYDTIEEASNAYEKLRAQIPTRSGKYPRLKKVNKNDALAGTPWFGL